MNPAPFIPPLYRVTQCTKGETLATVYATFTRLHGLPPAEIYERKPLIPHPAALNFIYCGPVPVETKPMPAEAKAILEERILTLLNEHPNGLQAREIAISLVTPEPFSNTALVARRQVSYSYKPVESNPGHYATMFFVAQG